MLDILCSGSSGRSSFSEGKTASLFSKRESETMGVFLYARPTGQRLVELTKGKWNDIVRRKKIDQQPDRSVPFTFRPKFRLLPSEVGLVTRIFENGTASFGRTEPTGQRGPPLEVDHFFRKISTWTKAFHLCFDWNFRRFWHNGKPLMRDFLLLSLVAWFLLRVPIGSFHWLVRLLWLDS